jgi:hypothetical protein
MQDNQLHTGHHLHTETLYQHNNQLHLGRRLHTVLDILQTLNNL